MTALFLLVVAQGGLPLVRVLTILKQAIAALMHLHSKGILHRDLRAANILVDSLDPVTVLVADFGISHQLSAFASATSGGARDGPGASKFQSLLKGVAAVGPLQVCDCCFQSPRNVNFHCHIMSVNLVVPPWPRWCGGEGP